MDAVRQDLFVSSNSDFSDELKFTIGGTTPVDITGYVFKLSFKAAPDTLSVLTLLTVASPIEGFYLVEPINGNVQIRINKETLDAAFETLNPAVFVGIEMRLYYDLVVTLPSGDDEIWLFGYMTVTKGITNV